ncbi:hypothetical protein B0O80DRAFT_439815 [Mortierella sp. GBAus27b]|nr:hypothetical protein BGX31_004734 [Mortierella sp. GBA43]KAI8359253.1 hypothetical protein B0O80DRAFT_439815 [Mortierella sp. GBAus27b]
MQARTSRSAFASIALAFLLGFSTVNAHSWVDCTNLLPSGECAGYPIGYPTRENPDINTLYTYLISGRPAGAPVCQPGRQDMFPGNNPANLPPASVQAGGELHLTWQANGHLEAKKTTVTVYWSGAPGKLIKTRGELSDPKLTLQVMDFATPQNCDKPENPNTVCHGKVTIPKDAAPGKYQLIWYWPFDKNPAGEEYSTCFEVDVKAPGGPAKRSWPRRLLESN